ncbi:MAG TPA: hypothetical protein VF955_07235 [Pyrinomonadaceae bacterium]
MQDEVELRLPVIDLLWHDLRSKVIPPAKDGNAMKTLPWLRIVLVALVLALLGGCAGFAHSSQHAVVGTWTNLLGTVWRIRADGTFDVDLNDDTIIDEWGRYTVKGRTISIRDTGGILAKGCKGTGVYRFKRGADLLQFTLVHDNCKLRVNNVTRDWHRVKLLTKPRRPG